MKKLKIIIGAILMVSLVGGMVGFGFLGGKGKPSNSNELEVVKNIKYNETTYKITWDNVQNADSYNIKINSDFKKDNLHTNEYIFYPKTSDTIKIQVQAVDSHSRYKSSKWSKEFSYTLKAQNKLKNLLINYVNDNINGELKSIMSAYVKNTTDGYILTINAITYRNGENKFTKIESNIADGVDTTSLVKVLESNPSCYSSRDYTLAVNDEGVPYNSMEHLIKAKLNGTQLQQEKDKGYKVEIVYSYTALQYNDPEGNDFKLYTLLKLTKDAEVKYFEANFSCHNKYPSYLEANVTYSLQSPSNRTLTEKGMVEITGDFLDATL